jgi:hypothetical protein
MSMIYLGPLAILVLEGMHSHVSVLVIINTTLLCRHDHDCIYYNLLMASLPHTVGWSLELGLCPIRLRRPRHPALRLPSQQARYPLSDLDQVLLLLVSFASCLTFSPLCIVLVRGDQMILDVIEGRVRRAPEHVEHVFGGDVACRTDKINCVRQLSRSMI